ncbi:unnamed protein product [Ceutorhynchus assimilis]|uniref:Amino acid transporter transmembrane domain-containing protein n=1 Tax=Ceutorhynchus assimilis TaxID=467358 RepID=A0A9N9MGJ9_9CUCU|nr:unnamed protein product [Ceutorhynchus assimilis]
MSDKIKRLKAEDRNDSYNSFSAAINSREQLTPRANAHSYAIELSELKRKEAGDYDPYDHSDIEHPTTNFETLIHLLKSSFGTGILAMPLAFSHSGYVLGIIGTALIGMLCTYCMHMLVRTEYELCKRKKVPSLTYPGTAEAALSEGPPFLAKLAPYSGNISYAFLLIYQFGSSCVYIVFVGQNLSNVINMYTVISERIVMLMILLPLILITFVRNLKYLAPLTAVANGITVISFGIIYYYVFEEEITLKDRLAIGKVRHWPLFFGTVMFALESIGMVLPLQHEMKNRAHFSKPTGTLNIGMFLVVVLYITTGLFGYLAYGAEVGGSISYTISPESKAAQACKILLALAIFTSFALFMCVGFDIIWNQLGLKTKFVDTKTPNLWEYVLRTLLACVMFGLAILIPYIDLFISLVGALCIPALGLAFPAIFDSCIRWYYLEGWQKTISNTFLLLYQLGICCVYTVFVAENIKNVLDQYMTDPLDERIIMLITLLPLIFINYIKNLKFLAPITTLANVLTFVSFAIIFYFIFNKKVSFENRDPIGDYRDFPLYFGTVLFALEAIGMIMPLKNEMRNPQSFGSWCGVLNIGMFAVVLLYVLTGFFGYLAYGKHVGGSISYTIDPENIAAQVCKLMLALAIFTTHALSMYVAIDIVWTQNLLRRFEKSNYVAIWEYVIRTALVVLTFGLAVAIPYIDLFISLVGAFCISIIGIAVPAVMDSCVQWQSHRGLKMALIHAKNIAIILFALLGLVVGTATSIEKIIEKFGIVEGSTNSTIDGT